MSDNYSLKMNFLDEILENITGFSSVRRKVLRIGELTNHLELLVLELKSIKYLIFFSSMVEPFTNLVNRIFGLKIIFEVFLGIMKLLKKLRRICLASAFTGRT